MFDRELPRQTQPCWLGMTKGYKASVTGDFSSELSKKLRETQLWRPGANDSWPVSGTCWHESMPGGHVHLPIQLLDNQFLSHLFMDHLRPMMKTTWTTTTVRPTATRKRSVKRSSKKDKKKNFGNRIHLCPCLWPLLSLNAV